MGGTQFALSTQFALITLRADFFDRCLEVPILVPLVQNHQLLLGELSPAAMHDVIVRPAQQAGVHDVAFSPNDGLQLVSLSNGSGQEPEVFLWDARQWNLQQGKAP